jgi:hypothetical protein
MLQAVSADTKKATARGNSQPPAAPAAFQAPPVPVLGNQAALRLMRKCDCGGAPDCDCDMGDDKKKKAESPRTALHRKPSGSGPLPAPGLLDAASQSFFEARLQRKEQRPTAPPNSGLSIQIGAIDDPLEREADQIADRVLRMPDNTLQAGGLPAVRNGTALLRKTSSTLPQGYAPSIVHNVLSSPGQPLHRLTRNFFEPRFGCDLSQVRIHIDTDAAQSAQSVQAQAWTVGRHIAFGPGMYSLSNPAGRALLAHELAHTLQQQESQPIQLQRVCDKGAACAAPIKGDSGRFGEKTELEAEAERKKTPPPPGGAPPPGTPTPCNNPRHRTPATSYTTMASGAGASIPPEVSGIFIDACMPPSAGGYKTDCASFPDGTPPGADSAKDCIAIAAADEDTAAAILAKPKRSAQDNETVLESARVVTHEAQHTHFDANATALVPAAADCNLNTVVFHGPSPAPSGLDYTVEFYLSEISAEIAEFAPFFQKFKATGSNLSMNLEEQSVTIDPGENILGDIKALRCKCECDTVGKFVGQVFADATKSWPPAQTLEFQRAMTRRIPSFWPKALQKT